ncbi:MAG: hypothetical protein RMJ59_06670 [Candidatus Nitrosocaldus sp.]|nr:hypothetical protein [Candidatus Nitrosocaldus sp.]MDW8276042.1 hypothetical protein [Candidatus Nitrosocaldus sp.]
MHIQISDKIDDLFTQVLQDTLGVDDGVDLVGDGRYASIVSNAMRLYIDLSRGYRIRSKKTIICTAIYAALRLAGYAITVNAFADRVGMDVRRLAVCYRAMQRVLGLTVPNPSLNAYIDEVVRWLEEDGGAQDRYTDVDTARLKEESYRLAGYVNSMMNGRGFNPAGMAAAIVYLSLDERCRKAVGIRNLARITGVSVVTVKKRIEDLKALLNGHVQ